MKAFMVMVLVAAMSAVAHADEDSDMQEMMQMLHQTCVDETGISEDLIARGRKGDFADDKTLKCYMKCIFSQTSSISDSGVFDADTMISMLPEKIKADASKAITACKDEKGADACEVSYNIHKCLYKQNPQLYYLI